MCDNFPEIFFKSNKLPQCTDPLCGYRFLKLNKKLLCVIIYLPWVINLFVVALSCNQMVSSHYWAAKPALTFYMLTVLALLLRGFVAWRRIGGLASWLLSPSLLWSFRNPIRVVRWCQSPGMEYFVNVPWVVEPSKNRRGLLNQFWAVFLAHLLVSRFEIMME